MGSPKSWCKYKNKFPSFRATYPSLTLVIDIYSHKLLNSFNKKFKNNLFYGFSPSSSSKPGRAYPQIQDLFHFVFIPSLNNNNKNIYFIIFTSAIIIQNNRVSISKKIDCLNHCYFFNERKRNNHIFMYIWIDNR
jgi:hypothetical protein